MSSTDLRAIVSQLEAASSTLAALGAALDARCAGVPLTPAVEPHVAEVVSALDAHAAMERLTPVESRSLLGQIRTHALTNVKLLFAASRAAGWMHTEPEILIAAGDVSATFPAALRGSIAPQLEGLVERLTRPGAAFLDIGVGVAALAIEMARHWPALRVVGLDTWQPALALARERVDAAGLAARIELRQQAAEEMPDLDAFDLVWLPSVFVPGAALGPIVRRVRRALRRGGWLLVPTLASNGERLPVALARLRTALFGGTLSPPSELEALLHEHGFSDVRFLPSRPGSLTLMLTGRQPA